MHGTIALHYSHSAYGAVHGIECCIAGYCTVRIFCLQLLGTIALQFASMQGVALESLAADLARKGSGRGRRGRGTARFVRFHGYGGAGPHTPVAVTAARVRPALSPATHTGISQGPATQGHHAPELLVATHAPATAPPLAAPPPVLPLVGAAAARLERVARRRRCGRVLPTGRRRPATRWPPTPED